MLRHFAKVVVNGIKLQSYPVATTNTLGMNRPLLPSLLQIRKDGPKNFEDSPNDSKKNTKKKDNPTEDPFKDMDEKMRAMGFKEVFAFRIPPRGGRNWIIPLLFVLYWLASNSEVAGAEETTWLHFRNNILPTYRNAKLVVVNKQIVYVYLDGAVPSYYFNIGSVESFEYNLQRAHTELGIEPIQVKYKNVTNWTSILVSLAPTALLFGGLYWLSKRASSMGPGGSSGSSIFSIGKSKAKKFNLEDKVTTTFKDVAGCDEAKEEIMEFVKFLKEPKKFTDLGAKIPRGAILSGPPGTGKTLLAKATAGEAGVPFFSVSGSEFVEMYFMIYLGS